MLLSIYLVLLAAAIGATYLAAIRQTTVAASAVFGLLLWGVVSMTSGNVEIITEAGNTVEWGNAALIWLGAGMMMLHVGLLFLGATNQLPGGDISRDRQDRGSDLVRSD
jgi:hypothetical protein